MEKEPEYKTYRLHGGPFAGDWGPSPQPHGDFWKLPPERRVLMLNHVGNKSARHAYRMREGSKLDLDYVGTA